MPDDADDPFDEFDDLFRSFDEAFETAFGPGFGKVREMMERMLRQMEEGELEPGKPFVYGFTVRMGPDGKPVIDDFGNTDEARAGAGMGPGAGHGQGRGRGQPSPGGVDIDPGVDTREPLVDVIEGPDEITVTVELPGVEKEDIDLTADEREMTIHVDAESRRYFKTVELPARVDPDSVTATYRNGVLDVTLARADGGGGGRKVPIQ